jgi:DNA-binding GntR family transcriptional regulator
MYQPNQLALELSGKIVQFCRDHEFGTGDRLAERRLAEAFGVSRSPIRAALKVLEERAVVRREERAYVLAVDACELADLSLDVPPAAADQLYVQILRDRFSGRLADQVSEADLLREYGITRSTLVKALMRLNHDGHVSRSPGRGWIFHETLGTVEAYRASYEFRLAIEPAALNSPHYQIDNARAEALLERHLELLGSGAEGVNAAEWFSLDAELHEMLASFSGNEFFVQGVQSQNRLRRIVEIESFYANERVKDSFEEHIAILEALLKGDRTWAATLLTRHLKLARQSTEVFLTKDDASASAPGTAVENPARGDM